ncbi:MAG: hypothetical protein M3Q99_06055 [Acidobacteriota bacterium]|nr:hypothetical protein [Acidobacteriota bacterium]
MMKKFTCAFFSILLLFSFSRAQQAEVTIQLNEQFFDALLDAVFKSSSPLEFPLVFGQEDRKGGNGKSLFSSLNNSGFQMARSSFGENKKPKTKSQTPPCNETIKLQREIDGVRTAVRFRENRIYAPIAFSGNYNPPLIGCIGFSGWAETNVELEFDRERQTLVGRAKVLNVQLSGTRGIGSAIVTKLVQSSIDKKINPINILPMDKLSFVVPIQNAASLRMKAVGMRHEIAGGALNVRIIYEFLKVD